MKEGFSSALKDSLNLPRDIVDFNEYINVLQKRKIPLVTALPGRRNLNPTNQYELSQEARLLFEFNIQLQGANLRHYHICDEFEGPNNQSVWSARTRSTTFDQLGENIWEEAQNRTFLTANLLLQQIRGKIPGIQTVLLKNQNGQLLAFSEDDYKELDKVVKQTHIKPWDSVTSLLQE